MVFATLVFLGLLCVGSAVYFARLGLLTPAEGRVPAAKYGPVELCVALGLSGLFLFAGYSQLTSPAGEVNIKAMLSTVVLTLGLVTLVLGMMVAFWLNPISLFGLWGRPVKTVLVTAGLGLLAILPVIFFIQSLLQVVFGQQEMQSLLVFVQTHPGFTDRAVLILTAVVSAPLTEEILFRGYLYGVYKRYLGRWVALLLSAFIFAALHGHLPAFPGLFVLAATLTLAYEFTGSLWTNVLIHAGFNAISIVLAINFPQWG